MEIVTERLIVRPYQEKDFDEIARLLNDPVVMKFSSKGPVKPEKAKEYIYYCFEKPFESKLGLWPIIEKKSACLIGFAGLIEQNLKNTAYIELGYRLNPRYWGQGYAKEACSAIMEYAKTSLKIFYLISIIDVTNKASLKLSEKLGFKLKEYQTIDSVDCAIYEKKLN